MRRSTSPLPVGPESPRLRATDTEAASSGSAYVSGLRVEGQAARHDGIERQQTTYKEKLLRMKHMNITADMVSMLLAEQGMPQALVAQYRKVFADNGGDKVKVCAALGLEEGEGTDEGEAACLRDYLLK